MLACKAEPSSANADGAPCVAEPTCSYMEDAQVPDPEPETDQEFEAAQAPMPENELTPEPVVLTALPDLEAPPALQMAATLADIDAYAEMPTPDETLPATLEDDYATVDMPSAEPLASTLDEDAGPVQMRIADILASVHKHAGPVEICSAEPLAPVLDQAAGPVETPSAEPLAPVLDQAAGPDQNPSAQSLNLATDAVPVQERTAIEDAYPVEIPTEEPPAVDQPQIETSQACLSKCQEIEALEQSLCPPPAITDHAIMQRLRRIFKRRANGEFCEGITQELADMFNDLTGGGRDKIKCMFEKAGYEPDRGPMFSNVVSMLC